MRIIVLIIFVLVNPTTCPSPTNVSYSIWYELLTATIKHYESNKNVQKKRKEENGYNKGIVMTIDNIAMTVDDNDLDHLMMMDIRDDTVYHLIDHSIIDQDDPYHLRHIHINDMIHHPSMTKVVKINQIPKARLLHHQHHHPNLQHHQQ